MNQIERERKDLMEPLKQLEVEIKKLQEDLRAQDGIIKEKTKIKSNIDRE